MNSANSKATRTKASTPAEIGKAEGEKVRIKLARRGRAPTPLGACKHAADGHLRHMIRGTLTPEDGVAYGQAFIAAALQKTG